MRKFAIVAWHTFCKQARSWSFVMVILGPLIILAITIGTEYVLNNRMGDTYAVVSNNPNVSRPIAKANVKDYVDDSIDTVSSAKKSLQNDDVDGYVDIEVKGGQVQVNYFGTKKIDLNFKKRLLNYLKRLQDEQDSKLKSRVSQSKQTPVITEHLREIAARPADNSYAAISIMFVIMFITVSTYSNITAQEVAADKGTKVIEVIFSSISALKYFAGKITGILGLVVLQLLIYLVLGVSGLEAVRHIPQASSFMAQINLLTNIDAIMQSLSGTAFLFILLGIILFMVLAAYCGAVVKRAEDASKAAQPVTYLLFIIFFIGLAFNSALKNPFMVLLSFIPGFSSFIMPLRLITKTANNWEGVLALLILLGCVVLSVFSVGKSYKRLMLQNDSKPFCHKSKKS